MKISETRLRQIIKEEKFKLLREQANRAAPPQAYDHGDVVLKQAMDIFGSDVLVDEQGGEVVVDTGNDQVVADLYDKWIQTWPDGQMEQGGLIYTGVMV
jgi:hypothetical protein